jgi:hypothetical protein
VELQSQQARNIRVRENRRPAAAPQGFTALEPVSYIVEMSGNTRGLALQKIDYIRNANSEYPLFLSHIQSSLLTLPSHKAPSTSPRAASPASAARRRPLSSARASWSSRPRRTSSPSRSTTCVASGLSSYRRPPRRPEPKPALAPRPARAPPRRPLSLTLVRALVLVRLTPAAPAPCAAPSSMLRGVWSAPSEPPDCVRLKGGGKSPLGRAFAVS